MNKLKFTDYHFGSPVMRLLHVQNKPDLAMEIFMDEVRFLHYNNAFFSYRD